MKTKLPEKTKKITYTDEPQELGWEFDEKMAPLTPAEIEALGLALPKGNRESRINIRLKSDTLSGLKKVASRAGMPYQTLAAAVLHQVAVGRLRFELIDTAKKK